MKKRTLNKKRVAYAVVIAVIVVAFFIALFSVISEKDIKNAEALTEPVIAEASGIEEPVVEPVDPIEAMGITDEEIELLALVTVAEAEGEPVEGQRLVISTILNRVDSEYFPNTIYDVIYQKGQFTSMWNGRSDRCVVTEEMRQLVRDELLNRTNSEILYFRANYYHGFGTPVVAVGNHYFSSR